MPGCRGVFWTAPGGFSAARAAGHRRMGRLQATKLELRGVSKDLPRKTREPPRAALYEWKAARGSQLDDSVFVGRLQACTSECRLALLGACFDNRQDQNAPF